MGSVLTFSNSSSESCKLWYLDDITPCARQNYFDTYLPLLIGSISLLFLTVKSTLKFSGERHIQLTSENEPLLASNETYGSTNEDSKLTHDKQSVKDSHFSIFRISDTNSEGIPHGELQFVTKSYADRIRVTLEELLLIGELGISVSPYFLRSLQSEWSAGTTLVRSFFWLYLLTICTLRFANLTKVKFNLPNLWIHSTSLYLFIWIPAFLSFRSVLIHPISKPIDNYYILEFIISSLLLFLNFTSTSADKPAKVYVTSDGAKPSPESVSSLTSLLTYSWLDPMIWSAYNAPLQKGDVWGLRYDDYALFVLKTFESAKNSYRFTIKLFYNFKFLFAIQAFWAVFESIIMFAPSLLLKNVLEYVSDPSIHPANLAWFFVFLMPVSKIVDSLSTGISLFIGRRVCARMRAIIIAEVYAKALRRKISISETEKGEIEKKVDSLIEQPASSDSNSTGTTEAAKEEDKEDPESKKSAELGQIINLMAVDAFKISEICGYLHYFVGSVLSIFTCIYLLFNLLGWSALVGASAVILLFPLNYKVASLGGSFDKKMLAVTDKRIQKLNETFQSIRIIKFFAWENKFSEAILKIRAEEIHYIKLICLIWTGGGFLFFITPTLITFLSFYCYTIIDGKTLTTPIAFTSLSLFNLLRGPLDQLSYMTSFLVQSKVSLDRVEDFLNEEETEKYDQLVQEKGPNSPIIGFEEASFSWNSKSGPDFKLEKMNVHFKEGKLNVIVGPTGSGKTSLLLALLGEMKLTAGKVFLPGYIPRDELVVDPETGLTESVAYCSQSAWLLNDTIRNNIIFGSLFNQDRYDKVVKACALARDFTILSAGDSTEIGEKGITLSGGQKQRVSLARALYSNSKHVLLDDCLSAVDSHTALWIYENCITGPLMLGRTCILVSHNVALTVQQAELVIVMKNGKIKSQGSPEDLLKAGELGDDELVRTSVINSRNQSTANFSTLTDKNEQMAIKAAKIETKLQEIALAAGDENTEEVVKTDGKLVEEERKAEGYVSFDVYAGYAKIFGGWSAWLFLFSIYIGTQLLYMVQSWWLKNWSSHSQASAIVANGFIVSNVKNAYPGMDFVQLTGVHYFFQTVTKGYGSYVNTLEQLKDNNNTVYYITIYSIIGILYSLAACAKSVYTRFAGIRASNRIFEKLLHTVLRAKLRFFDSTPQGRIMNRFSKDIESVDQELTPVFENVFMCFIECFTTILLIIFITPGFTIFAFIICFCYYLVGIFYVSTSRELKRLESITKSPIHQHFGETLVGISTIRAYGNERRFMKQNLEYIDENNRPFFYLWVANRWLSFRIELVGSMVMFFAGVFVLYGIDTIDAGLAGLSLSYAISFSESALWVVRLYSNLEMNMNSVERLQEYFTIEEEPAEYVPENEPPASWPEAGAIEVKNVSLRYAPKAPLVIKNVSFDVSPASKIGIVGRTGAGKSTIITAFFRFLDPETGSIIIDGINITKIGLSNLRQAITIIPQDPTLFTGTIRSNLDPFEQYTDAEMFEVLKRVNLIEKDEVAQDDGENQNKFLNLDNSITEGGSNLSQGQRQLVCLARSLLRSPKVILLDEATASIDYKSDALIQQTIREQFSNSTILTIAHRLRSIIDYDKILVMDAGRVVEYDEPYKLISDNTSLFYSMCENSGELDVLGKLAREASEAKAT